MAKQHNTHTHLSAFVAPMLCFASEAAPPWSRRRRHLRRPSEGSVEDGPRRYAALGHLSCRAQGSAVRWAPIHLPLGASASSPSRKAEDRMSCVDRSTTPGVEISPTATRNSTRFFVPHVAGGGRHGVGSAAPVGACGRRVSSSHVMQGSAGRAGTLTAGGGVGGRVRKRRGGGGWVSSRRELDKQTGVSTDRQIREADKRMDGERGA